METFTIYVDLSEKGVDPELVVSPQGKSYLVRLDGVIFTILEYEIHPYPFWRQIGGKLDEKGITAISEAIEQKANRL